MLPLSRGEMYDGSADVAVAALTSSCLSLKKERPACAVHGCSAGLTAEAGVLGAHRAGLEAVFGAVAMFCSLLVLGAIGTRPGDGGGAEEARVAGGASDERRAGLPRCAFVAAALAAVAVAVVTHPRAYLPRPQRSPLSVGSC